MPTRRPLVCALVYLVGALYVPGAVTAGDPVEDGRIRDAQALMAQMPALAEAGDKDALRRIYPRLGALHDKIRSKSAHGKIQKAIGAVARNKDYALVVRLDAIAALGKLFDVDGAWKQLERLAPTPREETVGQLGLAVLEAARVLAAEGARNELEKLVAKGKDLKAAGIAVRALGAYGFSKKRIKVLDFLVAQLRRIQPGTNRARIDRTDRERYDTLSPHFIAALNQLTGRTYRSTEVWLDRYDQAKRDLDALFTRRLVR